MLGLGFMSFIAVLFFEKGFCYIAQTNLEVIILLPLLPKCFENNVKFLGI